MSFIIIAIAAVWQHPDKAIIIMFFFLYNNTAGNDYFLLLCNSFHPLHRFAIHTFSKEVRLHTKACAEHLRQYNYFGGLPDAVYLLLQHGKVSLLIFPVQAGLYQCKSEWLHTVINIALHVLSLVVYLYQHL